MCVCVCVFVCVCVCVCVCVSVCVKPSLFKYNVTISQQFFTEFDTEAVI